MDYAFLWKLVWIILKFYEGADSWLFWREISNGFGWIFKNIYNLLLRNLACKTTTSPPNRLYKLIAAEQEKNQNIIMNLVLEFFGGNNLVKSCIIFTSDNIIFFIDKFRFENMTFKVKTNQSCVPKMKIPKLKSC